VFPIIWLLGAFDLVNPDVELYAYLTIDVSVKVVFSVFLRQVTLSSIEHREVQEYEKFKVCLPILHHTPLRSSFCFCFCFVFLLSSAFAHYIHAKASLRLLSLMHSIHDLYLSRR
jgi:hypothetical protein